MRLVGIALAGLLAGSGVASAQYMPGPIAYGPGAQDAAEIAQAVGLDPIAPPVRSGRYYVLRARDDVGRVVRVTVDARRSQIVSVEGGMRGFYGPPVGYGPYARPYYPPYPRGEAALAPPGSIVGTPAQPRATPRSAAVTPNMPAPPSHVAPKPAQKSATAPVPRKRPAAAPHEAVGSVEPIKPETAPQPETPPAPPQNTAPAPVPNPTPPVTPLE